MDCLLCPGLAGQPGQVICWLLSMAVCRTCTDRYLCGASGNWVEKVSANVISWAILVTHMMHTHILQHYPLRVSTRMAHAELIGLEVDPADFICWPTLEVDVHGFTQPVGM